MQNTMRVKTNLRHELKYLIDLAADESRACGH